jgi:hypothetical protein
VRTGVRDVAAGADLGLEAWVLVLAVLGWAVWRAVRAGQEAQRVGGVPGGVRVRLRDGRNAVPALRALQRGVVVRFVDVTTCARGHRAELRVIVTTVPGARPVRTLVCPTCVRRRCPWCSAPVPADAQRCACRRVV